MTESHALIRTMSELESLTGAREMYFPKLGQAFGAENPSRWLLLWGMRKSRSFVALTAQGRLALPQDDKEKGDEEKQVLRCAQDDKVESSG